MNGRANPSACSPVSRRRNEFTCSREDGRPAEAAPRITPALAIIAHPVDSLQAYQNRINCHDDG